MSHQPGSSPSRAKTPRSKITNSRCLSAVMPVYNEAATVADVIKTVLEQSCVHELVVVDDCSGDDSWKILQELSAKDERIKAFHHEVNQGKGAALRTGISKT